LSIFFALAFGRDFGLDGEVFEEAQKTLVCSNYLWTRATRCANKSAPKKMAEKSTLFISSFNS